MPTERELQAARRSPGASLRSHPSLPVVSLAVGVVMHNLPLLEVSHVLASSRLQLDFASLEPLLLIGIGMAAGWVWGKYSSSRGHEQVHVAGRDVSSAGCSVCSGTSSVGPADTDAAASEHNTGSFGSIR